MQKVKLRLAKESKGKDVLLEDIVPMKSNDELLLVTQRRLGRNLTAEEVRVMEALGAKVRAHILSQL